MRGNKNHIFPFSVLRRQKELFRVPQDLCRIAGMPVQCPGVDSAILDPRNVWSDTSAYDASAMRLRGMFRENFATNRFADFGIQEMI